MSKTMPGFYEPIRIPREDWWDPIKMHDLIMSKVSVHTAPRQESLQEIVDVKNYVTPLEQYVRFEFNDEKLCRAHGVQIPAMFEIGSGCPDYLVLARDMEKLTEELAKAGIIVRYTGTVSEPRFGDPTWQTLNRVSPCRVP